MFEVETMTQDYASLKAQGDAALSEENFELAQACFQQALALAPDNPESYNNLGRLYDYQVLDEKAKQFYLKALELNPYYFPAVSNLGIFYLERYQYAACIDWFQKAVALSPNNPNALANTFRYMGMAYEYLDDHVSAENCYRKGLELDPENSYLQLGLACRLGYRYEDNAAYEILIKLVDTATPDLLPDVYHYLGAACKSLKEFDTAIDYFNKAIALAQDASSGSYRRLAEIYETYNTREGDEKAIQMLKTNIENGAATFEDYYNLGRLYSFIDEYEISIQYFHQSIKLKENKKAYSQLARVLFIIDDYLKSIESIKKAIAIDGNNPKYHALLGFSYFKLDDFEAMLESFMQSLDLEGFALEDCTKTYDMIASLLQEMGNYEHLIPLFMAAHERVEAKFSMQDSK